MRIALLVFGQFRAAEEILAPNLKELQKAFPGAQFDVYILTDKKAEGNYSTDLESYIKTTLESNNMSLKALNYWESMTDCYALEDLLSHNFLKVFPPATHTDERQHFNARLWFRRYILWKVFEQSPDYSSYDFCLFTRIFDTSIKSLRPCQISPDTLLGSIDTLFIGTQPIMKKLFQFGQATFWTDFTWTPEFTAAFATFDSCLANTKPTFCSEVQIFRYILAIFPKWQNIRWDFNAQQSPSHAEAYFHIRLFRGSPKANKGSPIPAKILQIAIGDEYIKSLPRATIKENLIKLNPTYEYTFYTDQEIADFLQTHFPQYIPLYNSLQRPQYKSDLIRYLYLYIFGGWYIDIDLLPFLPLNIISEKSPTANFICMEGAHTKPPIFEMANGFIASKKGNPIFLALVNLMLEDPNPQDYGQNVKRFYKQLHSNTMNDVFVLKEVQGPDGKYYISYKEEMIGLSNGHGYPPKV